MRTFRSTCIWIGITLALILVLTRLFSWQEQRGANKPRELVDRPPSHTDKTIRARISETYGRLPLSFEINQGQAGSETLFLSRGSGYQLHLSANEMALALDRADNPSSGRRPVVRMKFVGANPEAEAIGREMLPGKSNYLIGNDPGKWLTNIPSYAKVEYQQLWPGVDLVYYGNQRQLEYDFVVAPGADPRAIRISFDGAEKLKVDELGNLALRIGGDEITFRKPTVYQEVNGARREIAGEYALRGRQAGFHLGDYDASRPLVIDPILTYSTYLGGSFDDEGRSIAVDAAGAAYVTGATSSANFPIEKAFNPTNVARERSAFVTKLNPAGTALVYSTYLGGAGRDEGLDIAVDTSGNAYVTGVTRSTNFPTKNPLQATPGGGDDGFVVKLNPAGSDLIYSTYVGGSEEDGGNGIAVDGAGAAYVTGFTRSTNFPTANPVQAANGGNGNRDAFILKLNPAGSALTYSTYLGGSSGDEGRDIAVDSTGAAHIVGQTFSSNFNTANPLQSIFGGGSSDAFIASLNAAGSALIYSTYLGGNGSDTGTAIAVDSFGNAFVTGDTASTNFPTKNPFQVSLGGQSDAFVSIVTSTGSALVYSTYLGGNGSDFGRGIALDASGAVVVAGSVDSTNFPTVNPLLASPAGSYDIFVSKFNTIGSALVFSTYLGGFSQDDANAIALDTVGNVYLTGRTTSTNFPVQNPIQNGLSGVGDVFVTKISEINVPPTPTPTPTPSPATVSVASATKTCIPTDAYPRIEAQPAAGPNFGAIPEQPPTQIRCTFEAEVVLDGVSGNTGPVALTIFDGFSPGLFFDRLTASSPTLTVAGYTGNVLTFNPILLQLPPQTVFQRFRISFEYFAFLNDLAEQRIPQQNCITMRFNDAVTGRLLLERGGICADTNVLVPRLTLEKYANTTTGLPGDTLKFTVIALSGGSIFLQTLDLDAIIPNNTTLVPGSIDPPPTRVIGNRIEWRGLGPINARGALPVSYSVTIDANTPADTKLVDQAFAHATTPNFAGAGTRRINASSNIVTVMVMSVRTGVDLTLTAAPAAGCPLTIINYTAVVTNTGQVTLDRLRLSLYPGTEPVAGNPEFPIQLDPLGPGEARTVTYKGQIGLKQKGTLVDIVTVVGRPVNNGIQVSELVGKVATATVRVSPPGISKITPASGAPGSSNLELKIEGVCFVPATVVSFQSNSGIEVIPTTPPDFGFVGTSELRRRINILPGAAPGEREAFVTNPNGDSGGLRPFNVFTVNGAFAAIEADASRLDFAGVPTGQSKDLALSVRNAGQAALTINPLAIANPRFSVMAPALPVTIAAGAQQSLIIRFSPVDAGAQSGAMTITSNAANRPNFDIALTGTGVGAPDIVITPGTLDFGTVPVGQTVSRSLSFGNPGNAELRLYAVTTSNPNFSVTLPPAPLIIPAGGVTSLAAIFTPTSTGAQTGTLLIASSAVNKNTVAIQVRGDTPGGQSLATDDGTVETGALLDGLVIVNRLTPPRYPVTLRSLRIFFAQFQGLPSPVGEQIKLIAFVDPAGSGQPPANPQLIVNQAVTIPAFPANGGFVDFPVTSAVSAFASAEEAASSLTIESGDLYIGFQAPRPAQGVVFAADSNGPQQQRAFYSTNDGMSYLRLGGIQNQTGALTPVNIMMQGIIGGAGLCTYAISPGSQVFTDTGGSGTVTVTAPNGCNWAANSTSNWIAFNANSSGTGNGTAGFTVGAGTMPRQAAVTIAGLPFIIAQAEKVASVSSASYQRLGLAGDAIAAAYGASLATATQNAPSVPLPTTLAGTTVKVRDSSGTELFASLFFVSPNQINFVMPTGLLPGTATVIATSGESVSVGAVLNDVVAPGIFTANASGQGVAAAQVLRLKANGAQIYESISRYDTTLNQFVAVPIDFGPDLGTAGDQLILTLFGTGWRYRSGIATVTCTIGGVSMEVLYAGPQGDYVGLDQMNLVLPRALAGRGEVDLVLTVDGKLANTVRINFK
jgi:uncharacterized protein (TIGR03437 family)